MVNKKWTAKPVIYKMDPAEKEFYSLLENAEKNEEITRRAHTIINKDMATKAYNTWTQYLKI